MAIVATGLTSNKDTALTATKTTASVTLTANQLALLAVHIYHASPLPTVTSVTSTGATWERITSVNAGVGGSLNRLELWRTMTAADQTGAITINLSDTTKAGWSVTKFSGVATTGTNGSGAIVQSATNTSVSGDSVTVTLAAFASASNGTYGANGHTSLSAITPGSGFTEIHEVNGTTFGALETQWRADNDTTVDQTGSGSGYNAGIAVELAAFTGVAHTQTLAATSTFSPAISKGYGKVLAVSSTFSAAITKAMAKTLAAVSTLTGGMGTEGATIPSNTGVSLPVSSVFAPDMTFEKIGEHGGHTVRNHRAARHAIRIRKG